MGNHHDNCGSNCNDSHDAFDHHSVDYWGGSDRDESDKKPGGCFIATAVYGDVMAPEVVSLRNFRDNVLKKHMVGRLFIAAYYKASPPVADWLKTKPRISTTVRGLLNRIVALLK